VSPSRLVEGRAHGSVAADVGLHWPPLNTERFWDLYRAIDNAVCDSDLQQTSQTIVVLKTLDVGRSWVILKLFLADAFLGFRRYTVDGGLFLLCFVVIIGGIQ